MSATSRIVTAAQLSKLVVGYNQPPCVPSYVVQMLPEVTPTLLLQPAQSSSAFQPEPFVFF